MALLFCFLTDFPTALTLLASPLSVSSFAPKPTDREALARINQPKSGSSTALIARLSKTGKGLADLAHSADG